MKYIENLFVISFKDCDKDWEYLAILIHLYEDNLKEIITNQLRELGYDIYDDKVIADINKIVSELRLKYYFEDNDTINSYGISYKIECVPYFD